MFRLKLRLKKKEEKEKSTPILVTKYLAVIASALRQSGPDTF